MSARRENRRCWEHLHTSKDLKAKGVGSCKFNSVSEQRKTIFPTRGGTGFLSLTAQFEVQRRKGGIVGRKGQKEKENGEEEEKEEDTTVVTPGSE